MSKEIEKRAVIRSLEIIGEAPKKLPLDFRLLHSHIPWSEIAGMRDILIHNYFGVDYDIVWNVIHANIPELKQYLEEIIDEQH